MKQIKNKIKKNIQEIVLGFNHKFSSHIANNFSYICRAEYLSNSALNSIETGISDNRYFDYNIIVSLTTYGRRLYEVYLAIESIMQQSFKPNKIILWLSNDFKNIEIPKVLKNQQNRGLEIKYCKDIKSYKKLIPALQEYPSDAILTFDDDHLYHFDLIENFIISLKNNPNIIHSGKMHRMKLINKNKFEKYNKWTHKYPNYDISPLNFPTGVGGILYPPNCFVDEIFNEKVFMNICQYADDIWFKAMSLSKGVFSKKVFTHNISGGDHLRNENSQYSSLSQINVNKNMNDIQIKAVFDKYNLYEKLY